MVLPTVAEPAAQQGTTNGEQVRGPLATPKHRGLFKPLPDDGFATRLHDT
jgi:hypothetical protein